MRPEPSSRLINDLTAIVQLDDGQRGALLAGLREVGVQLYPYDEIASKVAAIVSEKSERQRVSDVTIGLLIFFSNATLGSTATASAIAQRVATAAVLDKVQEETLRSFLSDLLAIEDLFLSIKGSSLFEDHDRLLLNSRVISDVRPIFQNDRADKILGTVLVHQLKLVYQVGQEVKDIYLTIGQNEFNELISCLKRVEDKTKAISTVLASSNILIVPDPEEKNG